MISKYKVLVICGVSGSGKSTLEEALIDAYPTSFNKWSQVTTRKMREGEKQGSPYVFMSGPQFKAIKHCLTGLNGVEQNTLFDAQYGSLFDIQPSRVSTVILSAEGIKYFLEDLDRIGVKREEVLILGLNVDVNHPFAVREGRDIEFLKAEYTQLEGLVDHTLTVSNGRFIDPSTIVELLQS